MDSTPDTPQRLSLLGLVPMVATNVWQALFGIIATGFGIQSAGYGIGIMLLGILAIVLLVAIGAVIGWWRTTYATGPEDIRVESGVFSRKARSVPYERIQDVGVEQPLLARVLGLVELKFETGAGGKDDIALSYVTEEEGERLRRLVRRQREGASVSTPDAGEAESVEEIERPVFAMTPGRIAVFGLFEFSLVVFGVLAAGLQQFDFLLPFDIWAASQWRERFGGPVAWLIGSGMQAQIVVAIFGLVSVALVGVATGIARTFAREYGFVLTRSERGFRRRRGLFTRTDVVMPIYRVQAGMVTTGWLRRLWGWHGLKFVSLAQDAGSTDHDAAPFAQVEEIEPIVRQAGLALPPPGTAWTRPMATRWVAGFGGLAMAIAFGAVVAVLSGRTMVGMLAILLLVPLAALGQWLDWRQHRHAIDIQQLYCCRGLFSRKLTIAPRQRIQSVEIRQGPLGRIAGYVDLHFGLPGGRLRFAGIRRADAYAIRGAVAETIARTDYSRLRDSAEE